MKTVGVILIVAGIVMLIFRSFTYTKEQKVVDLGPLQISEKQKETINWPIYAGAVAVIAGIAVVLIDKKKA